MNGDSLGRRQFVAVCATGCVTVLVGGCASLVTHAVPMAAGRVRIRLADFPDLARPNGAVKLQPDGMEDPVFVLANADGSFRALSPICTHRGCTVDVAGDLLACPCHGSRYDRDGRVLRGPAQRPLARYPLTRTGDELVIEVAA